MTRIKEFIKRRDNENLRRDFVDDRRSIKSTSDWNEQDKSKQSKIRTTASENVVNENIDMPIPSWRSENCCCIEN